MIQNALIIIPNVTAQDQVCDFLLQTAKRLAQKNLVIIPIFNHQARTFVDENGIHFVKFREILPLRRFKIVNRLNKLLFIVGLQLWSQFKYLSFKKRYLWIFFPELADLLKIKLRGWKTIFDIVDFHYSSDEMKLKELESYKKFLLKKADFVFTISTALQKLYQPLTTQKIKVVPQGFAIDAFQFQPQPTKLDLPTNKPIIGFVGQLSERLDLNLLENLVKHNQKWNFVLVGPFHHEPNVSHQYRFKYRLERLFSKYSNFYHFDKQPKNTIFSIISNFEVCIIPYDVTEPFNRYSYPMKVFEYFYAGKPVVSTPIEELKCFPDLIKIADHEQDFTAAIRSLLKTPWSKAKIKQQRQLATENSWDHKLQVISRSILYSSHSKLNFLLKMLSLAIVTILALVCTFFILEILSRIKILGSKNSLRSFFFPIQQPSVLGVSDWVIADPDLNYRFNPDKERINSLSLPEKKEIIINPAAIRGLLTLGCKAIGVSYHPC